MKSANKDKAKGSAEKAAGKLKQAVGEATGDKELKREGRAEEVKGHLRTAKSEFKKAVEKC